MVTTEESRSDIAEDITRTNHRAKRDIPKVGDTTYGKYLTPWDIHHVRINAKLTEWQTSGQAPASDA